MPRIKDGRTDPKLSQTVQKQYPFFKIMITHDSKFLMELNYFLGKIRIENEITSSNTIQKGKQQELWNPNRYGVLKRKSDYGSSPEHSAKKSSASSWQARASPPASTQT